MAISARVYDEHHVVLIPGFFGFATLGELPYFAQVEPLLRARLNAVGLSCSVHVAPTEPTASIRARAGELAHFIATHVPADAPLHLIGHSTGGLDARLLLAPGADVPHPRAEAIAKRVRSATFVATPHRGTPLASIFAGPAGATLLTIASLATLGAVRHGRLPLSLTHGLVRTLHRWLKGGRPSASAVESLHDQVLARIDEVGREALESFIRRAGREGGLIPQLSPDSMDLFNAATRDRPGVVYGSVLTRARPPGIETTLAAGFDAYSQLTHALYLVLYRLSGRISGRLRASWERDVQLQGWTSRWSDNDGVVPTRSQPWGHVLSEVRADHLDVIGHFSDPEHEPPHYDWLASGSSFGRADFEELWSQLADHLAAVARRPCSLHVAPPAEEAEQRPEPLEIPSSVHERIVLMVVASVAATLVGLLVLSRAIVAAMGWAPSDLGGTLVMALVMTVGLLLAVGFAGPRARLTIAGREVEMVSLLRGIYWDVETQTPIRIPRRDWVRGSFRRRLDKSHRGRRGLPPSVSDDSGHERS